MFVGCSRRCFVVTRFNKILLYSDGPGLETVNEKGVIGMNELKFYKSSLK